MKLFLSSYRIPNIDEFHKFVGKDLSDVRIALVPNAKDYYAKLARDYKIHETEQFFTSAGMTNVTIIDLNDYKKSDQITNELNKFDLVWVTGGNTYCLRYKMKLSEFDKAIEGLMQEGLLFGGESAGALIAGNSLMGVESADTPEFAEELIKDGLGLVPHYILPHVGNPEFAEAVEEARSVQSDNSVIEISDDQAVIFNNDEYRIV